MTDHPGFAPPITECSSVIQARKMALRLSKTDIPVLVTGESGTGRTTLAKAVVAARAGEREVATVVGLDGLKPMTDATCVLVIGVDDLSPEHQRRLGGIVAQGRVLVGTAIAGAAFDAALVDLVDAGTISLPPLRDRGDDATRWIDMLLGLAARKLGCDPAPPLTRDAQDAIRLHRWPGNLHEMRQRAERAVAMHDGGSITSVDLGLGEGDAKPVMEPLEEAVNAFRRRYVREALDRCGGNRSQAARLLKVDPRTIFRFLEAEGESKK